MNSPALARALISFLSLMLISGACAQNLVTNPGFESGNTGFSTDYTLWTGGGVGHDQYAVLNNPNLVDATWGAFGDHTTGSGLMLLVDGSTTAGKPFWRQTISVSPSTNYHFAVWTLKYEAQPPPILYLTINGVQQGTNYPVPVNPAGWQRYEATWNSGASNVALLELRFQTTHTFGNNLAFDDLYFSTTPPPSIVPPIPTLSEWGLIILAALLLGVGVVLIKRQSVKAFSRA